MVSDLMNDVVQLGMHHRLAAGDCDDGGTERSQLSMRLLISSTGTGDEVWSYSLQ